MFEKTNNGTSAHTVETSTTDHTGSCFSSSHDDNTSTTDAGDDIPPCSMGVEVVWDPTPPKGKKKRFDTTSSPTCLDPHLKYQDLDDDEPHKGSCRCCGHHLKISPKRILLLAVVPLVVLAGLVTELFQQERRHHTTANSANSLEGAPSDNNAYDFEYDFSGSSNAQTSNPFKDPSNAAFDLNDEENATATATILPARLSTPATATPTTSTSSTTSSSVGVGVGDILSKPSLAPTSAPIPTTAFTFPTTAPNVPNVEKEPAQVQEGEVVPETDAPETDAPETEAPEAAAEFEPTSVTFYVVGDAPYDNSQAVLLKKYMSEIPSDAQFVVHVGDMRWPGWNQNKVCSSEEYGRITDIMLQCQHAPIFMLVGDNDIYDCPMPYADAEELWTTHLEALWARTPQNNHAIGKVDQLARVPGTWSFTLDRILFIGMHMTSDTSPSLAVQTQWCMDLIDNYLTKTLYPHPAYMGRVVIFSHAGPDVTSHNLFFDTLSARFGTTSTMTTPTTVEASRKGKDFEKNLPILLIQGNIHFWDVQTRFYGKHDHWMKIIVEGEAREAPTKITVTANGDWQSPQQAFAYQRRFNK